MVSQGGTWVEKWEVPSSDGRSTYIVSRDREGNFGCSCPVWKFRRQLCKHIGFIEYRLKCSADEGAIKKVMGSPDKPTKNTAKVALPPKSRKFDW